MHPGANDESIPEPYCSILLDLNNRLEPGESISLAEVRGAVRLFYTRQYNRPLRELMKYIVHYSTEAGFNLENTDMKKIKNVERNMPKLLVKVHNLTMKKQFLNSSIVTLMSITVAMLSFAPFLAWDIAEGIMLLAH